MLAAFYFLERTGLKFLPRLGIRNPDSGSSQGREYKQGSPLSLYTSVLIISHIFVFVNKLTVKQNTIVPHSKRRLNKKNRFILKLSRMQRKYCY
jgi:hypothetical protein